MCAPAVRRTTFPPTLSPPTSLFATRSPTFATLVPCDGLPTSMRHPASSQAAPVRPPTVAQTAPALLQMRKGRTRPPRVPMEVWGQTREATAGADCHRHRRRDFLHRHRSMLYGQGCRHHTLCLHVECRHHLGPLFNHHSVVYTAPYCIIHALIELNVVNIFKSRFFPHDIVPLFFFIISSTD